MVLDHVTNGVDMGNTNKPGHTNLDKLFRYAEVLNYGDVHVKFDPRTGLRAIIAIHNLKRGPAIGGCRMIPYQSSDDALKDALRLGYMMSYKAAINNLDHGGAKAVIMRPKIIKNREAFLESFASFVHELGGRYITAVDSGTSSAEMDVIARVTPFVTCTTASGSGGDPSPETAYGVTRGIEAAVKFKFDKDTLEGVHVAIQGAGHVGYYLAKELHSVGAQMTMCDLNPSALERCIEEFGVTPCRPDEIYDLEADVFAPCALGAILNTNTIKRLKVHIVAGSANNQLAHQNHAMLLHERGILYAPDFLINAGGLIQVTVIYDHADQLKAREQISQIYATAMNIFELAAQTNVSPNDIALAIAEERLR